MSHHFGTLTIKGVNALTACLALTVYLSPQNARTQVWNDVGTCN